MTNKSQQKGTSFETSVLPSFQEHWPEAHRLGKQGVRDRGDIWLPGVPFVVECKNEQSYAGKLSGWLKEAQDEARNAQRVFGFVVHKRRGVTHPGLQYATIELQWLLWFASRLTR